MSDKTLTYVLSGVVLEKVCEYLYYNQKHAESKDVPDMDVPPELCLELLIAADYLDGGYIACEKTVTRLMSECSVRNKREVLQRCNTFLPVVWN